MNRPRRLPALLAMLLASAGAARGETLADAIALAYETNPQLAAQRAVLRTLDEDYVQARSGWGPTVGLSGQAYWQHTAYGAEASSVLSSTSIGTTASSSSGAGAAAAAGNTSSSSVTGSGVAVQSTSASSLNYGYAALTVSQPLYTGGKVAAEVGAAQAAVQAGRQTLRATETTVLQSVVMAYQDVLRDMQVLAIREDATKLLAGQVEETQAKFNVGQVTHTDVAQAQAQLAASQALLATARAGLATSRAEYVAAVGRTPGELAEPPPLPGVPTGVDAAFDAAEAGSPTLLQAQLTEAASRARVSAARANLRPTVSAQASYGAEGSLTPFATRDFDRVATAQVVYSQPIFTGGLNGSLVRQALDQNTADRISIETARRSVIQSVSQAWEALTGARAGLDADVRGLAAATTAFNGIREQYRVGLSSTLDVLIQQQTLESAQLAVASARHDAYVASAALLAAIGQLQAAALARGVPLYDPSRAFERVKGKGATPWEPLIAALDQLGEPSQSDEAEARIAQTQVRPEEKATLPQTGQDSGEAPSQIGPQSTP